MNPAKRLCCLLLLLSAGGSLLAQDAPPATIRLLAFSRIGPELAVAVVGPDAKPLGKDPLTLPTQQLSPPRVVALRSLVFTAPTDLKKILGRVSLPASGNEFILIFLPAAKDATAPYQVDAVALPAAGFGSGDYVFVNYSGGPVGCLVGGEKLGVAQGMSAIYHPLKSGKGAGNRSIVCYGQKDGVWDPVPFFSSRLIVQEGVRNLVLISLAPQTGQIDFRAIPDFIGG
ncbi:MAG: hypothetical protein NTW21_09045 [Verrucomicrobia bacterium]|nr:hypothetical protein [Verrucomicrobiota bacterium]